MTISIRSRILSAIGSVQHRYGGHRGADSVVATVETLTRQRGSIDDSAVRVGDLEALFNVFSEAFLEDFRKQDPFGWKTIIKPADQDVTNAGVTNDSAFSFPVTAGGWMVEAAIACSGNDVTGDYIFDFALSAGTMKGKGNALLVDAAGASAAPLITAAAAANTTGVVVGAPTADLNDLVSLRIFYTFVCSGAATFRYRFGNSAPAGGRTSRTKMNSLLRYRPLF